MCQNGRFWMASKPILRRVAKMAFEEGLTNEQIAGRLAEEGTFKNPNTKKVAQLLEEAGRWLLVREDWLSVLERDTENWELADQLVKAYPCLKDAMVIRLRPAGSDGRWSPLRKPTPESEAAEYLDDFAHTAHDHGETVRIALSGGETVLKVVSNLFPDRRSNVHFYSAALIGRGRMLSASHVGPETNATIAWLRSGSLPGHLHYGTIAPPEIEIPQKADKKTRHRAACEGILNETEFFSKLKSVRSVLQDLEEIDVLVTSFGLQPDLLKAHGVSPELLEGVTSDLNYCAFDAAGNPCKGMTFYLTPGYPNGLEFYRGMVEKQRRVVVVAGLPEQAAIRAALAGKLFNVLITDEEAAAALLQS
jgi:DNA-binding transcriptional regulator LsrR (DeoR family)